MSIQSNVNQLLGLFGAFSQLPGGQEVSKYLRLGRQRKGIQKQYETLQERVGDKPLEAGTKGEQAAYFNIVGQGRNIAQQRFEMRPSEQNLNRYIAAHDTGVTSAEYQQELSQQEMPRVPTSITSPADPDEIMQEQAEMSWQNKASQQLKQRAKRRNFMDYLRNESTSLGGTVGELPIDFQKQIAKQYSSKERKAMMDRIDREKESN